eukprot:maker-scaffold507_size152468-snap-gene-0.38 protein:Tk11919 transcript:maker-scaffold507_size152468-snap-gene-0.38-mRNA-1 annotation:"zinc transporter zip11 isoform x2"
MLEGYSPVVQALQGTLFTWGMTALGAAMAVVIQGHQRSLLDGSLGFAGGVMIAASYWSLLAPAIEMAEQSGNYGSLAFVPVAVGFLLGAIFVFGADLVMTHWGLHSPLDVLLLGERAEDAHAHESASREATPSPSRNEGDLEGLRRRHRTQSCDSAEEGIPEMLILETSKSRRDHEEHWKRILLLIVAITVHNIPEGLAVGVGFGAAGKSKTASFESARNLAIGIGIQNFPEGLAVSLPLKAAGFSTWRSIWYGQLSGLVEPVAGVLGACLVTIMEPVLPYALAFAAGAMIYVVVDDIIPEAQSSGNGTIASWGCILGFLVMMSLDVGLG